MTLTVNAEDREELLANIEKNEVLTHKARTKGALKQLTAKQSLTLRLRRKI